MARLAPAACSPCAIAQAIERLFATPKTTAVRPFRSSSMKEVSSGKRITASLGCVGRTLLSAAFDLAVDLAADLGVDLDLQNQLQDQCQRQRTGVSAPHKPESHYSATAATAFGAFIGQHALPKATAYTPAITPNPAVRLIRDAIHPTASPSATCRNVPRK